MYKFTILFLLMFQVLAGDIDTLFSIDDEIENSFSKTIKDLDKIKALSKNNDRFYFLPYQRKQITTLVLEHLKTINKLEEYRPFSSMNFYSKKKKEKYHKRLISRVLILKNYAKLLRYCADSDNAFISVLTESDKEIGYDKRKVLKAAKRTIRHLNITYDEDRLMRKDIRKIRNPSMADIASLYPSVLKYFDKFKLLEKEQINNFTNEIHVYFETMDGIKELLKDKQWRSGTYSIFYGMKVALLKFASVISLPGKHKISLETLKKVDKELEPGDIGLIQRYRKLSNIVFKGNWTHSLMYIGKYSKLMSYFNSDKETSDEFKKLCIKKSLACHDFETYLKVLFPKYIEKYKNGENKKDPIVTIESLKPGVILYNMKKSMGWDNLVLLRPKLSKKDKALAIALAFENLGKPYDYNFNGRTNERLVCTELISHSYSFDPRIDKKGLSWDMNYVYGKPVMYAYDILQTYFNDLEKGNSQLDLVIYIKGIKGKKGEFGSAKRGSIQELRKTL